MNGAQYEEDRPEGEATLEESTRELGDVLEKAHGLLNDIMDSSGPNAPAKTMESVPTLGLAASLSAARERADELLRRIQSMKVRVGRL